MRSTTGPDGAVGRIMSGPTFPHPQRSGARFGMRTAAFVAACVLQILIVGAFTVGLQVRSPRTKAPVSMMTQVLILPGEAAMSRPLPGLTQQSWLRPAPAPLSPRLPFPTFIFPVPERHPRPIDWAAAARLAANSVGTAEAQRRRRRRASGELPWGATDRAGSTSPPPAFPWSRQPLTGWMDFDPTKLLTTVHLGRRCVLAFFLIIPAFGCVLGHIDPDPGRGDLFAAKFAPRPLEIPEPVLPQPRAPQYNDVVGRRQSRLHQ